MKKINFSKDWNCKNLQNLNVTKVDLPHDAMIFEDRSVMSKGQRNIGWFIGEDYVYTKDFFIPEDFKSKTIVFEIEGAYHNSKVFINEKEVAYRPYGYSDYFVNAGETLVYGDWNQIQIYTYNSDQPNSRWYTGTGLFRPVSMYVGNEKHILQNGVKIRTLSIYPVRIEVEVRTNEEGLVNCTIHRQDVSLMMQNKRTTDRTACFVFEMEQAFLWDTAHPFLYQCRVEFEDDVVTETFGIRTVELNNEKGLLINNERVILRGACIHHDNGILGACAFPEAEERKIRLLKETGYNAIRSAHNPCSKELLNACDKLGMLVMDEYVDVWYIHKTQHDYAAYMEEWWHNDLKEMVDKDYNHPSVILYSTGNEVSETAKKKGIELTGLMTDYLNALDPGRPVTCGVNIFFNFLSSIGLGVYSDEKAVNEVEKSIQAKKENKKPVGSEFYNTLAGILGDRVMKLGATLYPCDIKTRYAFAAMNIAGYNYGIYRYEHDLKKYPERMILGTETFCRDAFLFWEKAKKYPRILGDFVWAGMDYIGEAGIGAWEYEHYAPKNAPESGWLTAGSGRLDILGYPNGEALYTKVAFEQTDEIHIAVRPVYQKGKHSPSAWKMTDAIPSWSFSGCEGMEAKIEVYARCHEIELFLNGKSLGKKSMKNRCRVLFKTRYEDGLLEAIAYNKEGTRIKQAQLETAGISSRLQITCESNSVCKDELVFFPMEYTDNHGIWKPMEKHSLMIEVTGGQLRGFGNACAYNPDGYKKNQTKTYYGRALAVVQADGSSDIELKVKDEVKEFKSVLKLSDS